MLRSERDSRLQQIRDAHRSWHHARERRDYASIASIEGKRYHRDVEWLLDEIERLESELANYIKACDYYRDILIDEGYNIEVIDEGLD